MVSPRKVRELVERLRSASSTVRCHELAGMLASLGFEVRSGKKSGHKVFVHHGIATFTSDGYTCGHGKNSEIKSVYVKKIARLLERYEDELLAYLREEK